MTRSTILAVLALTACTDSLETSDIASPLESRQIDAMNAAATGTGIRYVLHEDTWQAPDTPDVPPDTPDLELRLARVSDLVRTIYFINDVYLIVAKMETIDKSTIVDVTAGGLELTGTIDSNLALRVRDRDGKVVFSSGRLYVPSAQTTRTIDPRQIDGMNDAAKGTQLSYRLTTPDSGDLGIHVLPSLDLTRSVHVGTRVHLRTTGRDNHITFALTGDDLSVVGNSDAFRVFDASGAVVFDSRR